VVWFCFHIASNAKVDTPPTLLAHEQIVDKIILALGYNLEEVDRAWIKTKASTFEINKV
jgi:hypothetical protein